MSLEASMVTAFREGEAAARDRKPTKANPYDVHAATAAKRVLGKMWLRGYGEANPMVLDDEPVMPGKARAADSGPPDTLELARYVRTPAGEHRYRLPIGSPIGRARMTDREFGRHVGEVHRKTREALDEGRSTHLTEVDERGRYLPERRALHDRIVREMWNEAGGDDLPRDGHAVIAGGLTAAGKSTVLRDHAGIDRARFLTVDADRAKEKLAEHGAIPHIEGLSPMEASPLVQRESGHIAGQLAAEARSRGTNMVWDTPMGSRQVTLGHLGRLRAAGYQRVGAVFVRSTVEDSLERSAARHREGADRYTAGQGHGGRFVPEAVTRDQANPSPPPPSKNEVVFNALRDQFDEYGVWDNTGDQPRQVEGTGRWSMS